MTDKLDEGAGRGEGLAGAIERVKEFIAWATEQIGTSEAHGCAEQAEDALKLLEAAAPAGTALPPDWPECKEFYDLMQFYRYTPIVKQDLVVENYEEVKHWLRKWVAALATPSPQVGQEPRCRWCAYKTPKQFGFHQAIEGDFSIPCEDVEQLELPAVPAATQEQPAGSAPIDCGPLCTCGKTEQGWIANPFCPHHGSPMPAITVTDGAPPNASPPNWASRVGDEVLIRGIVKRIEANGAPVIIIADRREAMGNWTFQPRDVQASSEVRERELIAKWRKQPSHQDTMPLSEAAQAIVFARSLCADELETALEAAASPSTPAWTYAHMCRDGHEQIGHNDSESECCPVCRVMDDRDAVTVRLAEAESALATPSPQAPAEPQSFDALADVPAGSPKRREWLDVAMEQGCQCGFSDAWRCARKKGITTSLTCYCPCHKYMSVPAATQEQPAGSAAPSLQATKDETRGDVCEGNAPRLLAESPSTFGSPRKVGSEVREADSEIRELPMRWRQKVNTLHRLGETNQILAAWVCECADELDRALAPSRQGADGK